MGWLVFVSLVCFGAVIYVLRRAQASRDSENHRVTQQDRHAA